ncbi:MAG: amino acid adenylation domain-containing protein, partial [Pyrinomonadaceae bacterium]
VKERLPEYMVPSVIVTLDELPLNENGKVDRRRLPSPESTGSVEGSYVAPRTPTEQVLAKAWQEILKLDRVGINDNFFDLGGDSIRSIQVLARAKEYGVRSSVQQLFQHPTVCELARALDEATTPVEWQAEEVAPLSLISEADRARLPEGVEDAYPLARMQAGMLFHSEYDPTSPVYHDIFSLHLHARLDVAAMRATLSEVIRRHPILRTTFDLTGFSEPLQLARREVELPLEVIDLRHLPEAEVEAELAAELEAEKLRGFEWEREPSIRFRLYRRDDKTFQFMLSFHHALLDGWSLSTLMTELFQHYWFLLGESAEEIAPPPRLSYRHYIALEQQALKSAECRGYWLEKMSGCKPQRLPRWRPADSGVRPSEDKVTDFPAETIDGLNGLARATGTSLKYVALAAHLRVLALLDGQTEAVTGVVSHGRPEGPDAERVVGLFLNTLPFRVGLEGGTWAELVGEVFQTEQEMLPYRSYPLAEIKQLLDGQIPFETSFGFVHFHAYQALEKFGGQMSVLGGESVVITNFPLAVNFMLDPFTSKMNLTISFDGAELCAEQVDVIQGYYRRVLAEMARDPQGRYEFYSPLTEAERQQLLIEWNDTTGRRDVPVECAHRLFERRAARTPDAAALIYGDGQVSYGELNRRANRLAHYLRASGIAAEMRVGICLERSPELIVALLATLKAGGCAVTLDPAYPLERIAFILEDALIPIVLSQATVADKLPTFWGQVICVEDIGETEFDAADHGVAATPENAAYLIYTSGSTGTPRGVVVSHRGIGSLARWVNEQIDVGLDGRTLQFSSLSFDASMWEIFSTLLGGKTLVLADRERLLPGPDLIELLREQAVTFATLPPSVLAALPVEPLPELRTLVVAGEACTADLIARWSAGRRFINAYGPSETTVCASATVPLCAGDEPHIGRPIGNMRMHLLDAHLQPVPVGVPGEVCVAGIGLSRGYLNRPDLTALQFRPNPLAVTPGERVYRTGDLGQFRLDGNVEYLGRLDHQVKIRGFRIEPGEIEAVLKQHPGIREAIVTAREDAHGDKLLAAYIVPAQGSPTVPHGKRLYRLPNNLEIAHLNKNETDVMFREIFQEQMYLRHGITLRDGDCVFDVGANIGLFTLYVNHVCRNARVYAFEPVPPIFDVLRTNAALYGLNVELSEAGIADSGRVASVTFYPKMSGMSGLYADAAADEQLTRAFLKNQGGELVGFADELLEGRFASETYACQIKTLSQVINEQRVESIDLLKIDVEKSELDVLKGVGDDDWLKIKQVVMEVHDIGEQLARVTSLLRGHGFHVVAEEGGGFESTGLYHVYATRERAAVNGDAYEPPALLHLASPRSALSMSDLRQYLREKLPAYMVPAIIMQLDSLPLNANGKVDRRALPALEQESTADAKSSEPPATPVEQMLAQIWESLLTVEHVSRHEDFFDLGGHSLLATQVISRVRQVFEVDLPIQRLFDHPTVAELAADIEEARRGSDVRLAPPLRRVSRDTGLPLSFAQQRLWFIDQLIPGNAAYNVPTAMRLTGRLNVAALEQTLGEIIRRHEMLRTTFAVNAGQPTQVIGPVPVLRLDCVDLSSLHGAECESAARHLATREAWRPFDLASSPLLRARLLRLESDRHVLLLTMHHIISDGWSAGIFFSEMTTLYRAFIAAQPSPLAELPLQFADFAVWQRGWLQGETLEAQVAFWKEELAGAPGLLELPADRPRPAIQTFKGRYRQILLPAPLSAALRALSRKEGVTLFMTMLSAFQTLLSRYSGQEDICVGTPIANRNRAEIEGLIGFFVNTLVLRGRTSRETRFTELLRQGRADTLAAYAHQDMPFERLVDELRPERALSHTPLFQVMFIMQNTPQEEWALPGLTLSPLKTGDHSVRFDLTLTLTEYGEWLGGTLEYNTDLFDDVRIELMAGHFQTLLRGIVADPDQSLAALPLLTEAEQQQVLREWNSTPQDTRRDETDDSCLHHLFEAQARRTPDRLAIVGSDQHLTYASLDAHASRLAALLRRLGVGPEVKVGVLLARTPRLLTTLLAILKAGGAYVPLDPSYPATRLHFILSDSGARLLLSERSLEALLPPSAPPTLMVDEAERGVFTTTQDESAASVITTQESDPSITVTSITTARAPITAAGAPVTTQESDAFMLASSHQAGGRVQPSNIAYLIYTSGSTGRPKAVLIEHRSAARFLRWANT